MSQEKSTRAVPLQVLSLGMPRTGTCSMQAALTILGYNHTYHGFDTFDHPKDWEYWERAADAKWFGKGQPFGRANYDEFLGHCAATTDVSAMFADDLVVAYPEAKVVLVSRDVDRWKKSFQDVVVPSLFGPVGAIFINCVEPILGSRGGIASRKMILGKFNASTAEEALANAQRIYLQHYENIRRLVPPERLLEYKLGSGWEPLCEFLGKEVPLEEFPWLNETGELRQRVWNHQKKLMRAACVKVLPIFAFVAVAAGGYLTKSYHVFR